MKSLSLIFAFLLSFSSFALEVGDSAPCVVLNHINADRSEGEHCIRDVVKEDHNYTVLEFFSATCSDCRRNLPIFSKLAEDNFDVATFRLIGIDRSERLLRSYRNEFSHLINMELALDTDRDAKRAYDVFITPTLMILNRNNTVVYKHTGVLRNSDVAKITKLINQ